MPLQGYFLKTTKPKQKMPQPRKIPQTLNKPINQRKAAAKLPDAIPIDPNTITPPPGKSQEWLDFFWEVIEISKALGTDSWSDLRSVCEFCDVFEEVQRLKRSLTGPDGVERYTDIGSTGQPVVSANYKALNNLRVLFHKMLNDFGMTPRGKAYVHDKRKNPVNKAQALIEALDL
jgi:hypothetical protein